MAVSSFRSTWLGGVASYVWVSSSHVTPRRREMTTAPRKRQTISRGTRLSVSCVSSSRITHIRVNRRLIGSALLYERRLPRFQFGFPRVRSGGATARINREPTPIPVESTKGRPSCYGCSSLERPTAKSLDVLFVLCNVGLPADLTGSGRAGSRLDPVDAALRYPAGEGASYMRSGTISVFRK